MVEDPWQWEKRDGLGKEDRGGILVTDGLLVSVSVGTNANNGIQIHFGKSSSMSVVSQFHTSKWLCPCCLLHSLKFHSLCSLFPLHPVSLCCCHLPRHHACSPINVASSIYFLVPFHLHSSSITHRIPSFCLKSVEVGCSCTAFFWLTSA